MYHFDAQTKRATVIPVKHFDFEENELDFVVCCDSKTSRIILLLHCAVVKKSNKIYKRFSIYHFFYNIGTSNLSTESINAENSIRNGS